MLITHKAIEIGYLDNVKNTLGAVLSSCEAAWKTEMMRRARIAYHAQGGTRFPCPYLSRIAKHRNVYFAYLADSTGTLAVYRLKGEASFSRKAARWPKAIERATTSRQAMALYVRNSRSAMHAGGRLN